MGLLITIIEVIGSLLRALVSPLWDPIQRAAVARGDAAKRRTIAIVSIVLIVAALISLLMTQCRIPHRVNHTPYIAIGEVAAEQTVKLVGETGLIVLVEPDLNGPVSGIPAAQMKQFKKTLRQHPGLQIAATETVRPLIPSSPETVLTSELYLRILRDHPEADAIVSFVGAPVLSGKQFDSLPPKMPRCIAVGVGGADIKKLFQHDVIQSLIVSRLRQQSSSDKKPRTSREWFDQYFQVITSNTAASLSF